MSLEHRPSEYPDGRRERERSVERERENVNKAKENGWRLACIGKLEAHRKEIDQMWR